MSDIRDISQIDKFFEVQKFEGLDTKNYYAVNNIHNKKQTRNLMQNFELLRTYFPQLKDKGYYTLHFSKSVEEGLKTGAFKLMPSKSLEDAFRASAVNAKNNIVGNANLKSVSLVNPGQVLLSAASLIVAQQHLSNINQNLININKKLDKIIQLFDGQKRGTILGDKDHLEMIYAHLQETSFLSEEDRKRHKQTIDSIWKDQLRLLKEVDLQLSSCLGEIIKQRQTINSFKGKNKIKIKISRVWDKEENIETQMQEYDQNHKLKLCIISILFMCIQLHNLLGTTEEELKHKWVYIEKEMSNCLDRYIQKCKQCTSKYNYWNFFWYTSKNFFEYDMFSKDSTLTDTLSLKLKIENKYPKQIIGVNLLMSNEEKWPIVLMQESLTHRLRNEGKKICSEIESVTNKNADGRVLD